MSRRLLAALLALVCLWSAVLPAAAEEEADPYAPPAIENVGGVWLYNLEHDELILSHNADAKCYPASMVKIMTGLLAVEALGDRLDERVTVTAAMLKGVTGNNIALKAGETVTVKDMLYAGLCGGYNDACAVLAHLVGGDEKGFVNMMNERAAVLGATSTTYKNAYGMHDDAMVTTVADTAKVALAASRLPLYMEITSAAKYEMPATNTAQSRNIYNRNYLIGRNKEIVYYYAPARGLNAGSTTQGGYCVATVAEQNGLSYLCVVMGGQEVEGKLTSYTTARALLNWVFGAYGYVDVLDTGRVVCEVPVTLSEKVDYVTLLPAAGVTHYLPLGIDLATDIVYDYRVTQAELVAPVEEGQVAGFITVSYGDELLGTVDLVTKNAVERSEFLYLLSRVKEFSRSRVFIASVIAAASLTVVYVFGTAMYRYHRQQKQQRYTTRYRRK